MFNRPKYTNQKFPKGHYLLNWGRVTKSSDFYNFTIDFLTKVWYNGAMAKKTISKKEPSEKKVKNLANSKKGKKFGLRTQGEKGVYALDVKSGKRISKKIYANQWTNSPQQNEFLRYYLDPEQTETWGNAYLAATKAGYSESYASSIISVAPQWIQQANNIVKLQPEHLKQALASIANSKMEKASDRIQAIKLLGIDQGMFVQKQLVGHVNIEDALKDLK